LGRQTQIYKYFFYKPDETLRGLIEKHNLNSPRENDGLEPTDSRFHENIYDTREIIWLHFISSFSAHLTSKKYPNKNYLDYFINPVLMIMGVNVNEMMGTLDSTFKRAYLFTLGGDILQDMTWSWESPWDYRADILGLIVLKSNPSLSKPLSELVEEGYNLRDDVEGNSYKNHPLYKSSIDNSKIKWLEFLKKTRTLKRLYDLCVSGTKIKRITRKYA